MTHILADRRRNDNGEVDYQCPKGHHVHGDNVIWRQNGSGKKHPGCRECRRSYRANYKARPDIRHRDAVRAQQVRLKSGTPVYDSNGDIIPWETYLGTEKRNVPWNLLRPRAEASRAFDEFNEALKYTNVRCRDHEAEYTEYADPRPAFADDNEGRPPMPTRSQAKAMCAGCPLLEQCGTYARLEKPDFGIHGGERYLGGKVV